MDLVLLYSTWPDAASAEACAAALVADQAAACATVLAGGRSFYRWEGRLEAAQEAVLLVKTPAVAAGAARDLILARHPYELPCVLAVPVDAAGSHGPYLAWALEMTPRKCGG